MTDRGRLADLTRGFRSVRVRILSWVLLLTALGMAFAGAVVLLVERERIADRLDMSLAQEIGEFRALEATGEDPATGRRLGSVEELFLVALQQNVPERGEALFAFVDGQVRYHSKGPDASALRDDAGFVDAVARMAGGDAAGYTDLDTRVGHVSVAVLPVRDGGDAHAYAVAVRTEPAEAEFADVMQVYSQVSLAALALVAVVGWFVAGRLLAPVRDLRRTAQQISETDLTRRIETSGKDDLSELARTVNAMLDRLEAAFTSQGRFLDDAGHELRTPVTILRGHLELLDAHDPEDVAETRALVLDELDRMGRLVDDLVTLANAERPDFLHSEPVDLGPFVDDVAEKAAALGPRSWRVDARADAVVVADRQRLTQALLQLAQNAVKFTADGDEVGLGAAVDTREGTVRLWVRDTGPGVPPEEQARIFERLTRGAAGERTDGSGLGLAIVRAIALAHGGRVVLSSRPGGGARFTLVLPHTRATLPGEATTEAVTT